MNQIVSFNETHWYFTFQESAEKILRVSSKELGEAFEENEDKYNTIFSQATFRTFNFKMRAKADTYNDETRVKHTVRDWIVFMLFWIINVIVVAAGGGGGRGGL